MNKKLIALALMPVLLIFSVSVASAYKTDKDCEKNPESCHGKYWRDFGSGSNKINHGTGWACTMSYPSACRPTPPPTQQPVCTMEYPSKCYPGPISSGGGTTPGTVYPEPQGTVSSGTVQPSIAPTGSTAQRMDPRMKNCGPYECE